MIVDHIIKHLRWEFMHDKIEPPTRVIMSQKTFDAMVSEVQELMVVNKEEYPDYTVYGMKIEIRDDINPDYILVAN